MTNPKVVQTWSSVMASQLGEAAGLANGNAATDPDVCLRIADLLRESAKLLQCIAKAHRQSSDAAEIVAAGAVRELRGGR